MIPVLKLRVKVARVAGLSADEERLVREWLARLAATP
jgi:hypothetical protein